MGAGASATGADIHAATIDDIKTTFAGLPSEKQALLIGIIDAEAGPSAEAAPAEPSAEAAPVEPSADAAPAEPSAEAAPAEPSAEAAPAEPSTEAAPATEAEATPAADAALAAEEAPAAPAEAAPPAPVEEAPATEAAPEAAEKAAPPAAEEAKPDLTEEQQANLQKTFELMDSNKNSYIEAGEFQKACEQFGMPVTEGWVKDIFEKFDINHDAKIDLVEFTKLIVAAVQ